LGNCEDETCTDATDEGSGQVRIHRPLGNCEDEICTDATYVQVRIHIPLGNCEDETCTDATDEGGRGCVAKRLKQLPVLWETTGLSPTSARKVFIPVFLTTLSRRMLNQR